MLNDIDEETIIKILQYKELKGSKIENKEYLDSIIKEIEESIELFEKKNRKYAEYIKKTKYTDLDNTPFYNFKKYYKRLSRLKN